MQHGRRPDRRTGENGDEIKKRQPRKITPNADNVKVMINSGKQWVSIKKNAEVASGTIPRFI